MRIALVVPGGVDRSGTHRIIPCLLWLVERLATDHEVVVYALAQEAMPGQWPLLGARVRNAGRRPRRLRALLQFLADHRRQRFDVVHGFWAAGPGLVAALAGRLSGLPVVVSLPGGDLVALPDIAYGALLGRRGRLWTRIALARADRIIVPSRWMAAQARAMGYEPICIPFGVALDRWPPILPRPRSGATLRLLHVASLNPVKDQPTLLQAMALLKAQGLPFRLDIVGEDTLGGAIQRLCVQLGLAGHVQFHGFHGHAELRGFYADADLMVVSSRHEAGPLVTLEAAIAGLPTVGTAAGHIADWSPAAAIAVPVGDAEALAKAIAKLARDDAERLRLAHNAQAIALAEDADTTAVLMLRLYRALCGG